MRTIKRIIIHHTASSRDNTTLEMVDAWHRARWPQFQSSLGFWVGYHWLIGRDWIKQTRADQEDGAHTRSFNTDSIGISLTGNFEDEMPNSYQLAELRKLVLFLLSQYDLQEKDIYMHRDLSATVCPGKNITKEFLHNLFAPSEKQELTAFIDELQAVIDRHR